VSLNQTVVVVNPAAGGGKTLKILPRVHAALKSLNVNYHLHLTTEAGDGRASAARYAREGASLILAVGGDGTIHEVANGVYDSGVRVPFGVVPAGNGSDFARTIGSSKEIEKSIAVACSGRSRSVDAGLATLDNGISSVFVNIAGLGFDALVAERAIRTKFLPGANLPYLAAALHCLISFQNIETTVNVDGEIINTKAVFIQIANGMFMGGGYKIAPMADIEDGKLDLALVGDLSKPDLLMNIPKVYTGKHVGHPKCVFKRASSIRVETVQPANVQLDGEIIGPAPVTFTVLPAALLLAG